MMTHTCTHNNVEQSNKKKNSCQKSEHSNKSLLNITQKHKRHIKTFLVVNFIEWDRKRERDTPLGW